MRKVLFTLLALCFLGGLTLAGFMPVMASHAHAASTADRAVGCDHHAPQKQGDPAKMACDIASHCPMLGQGVLQNVAASGPVSDKSSPYPAKLAIRTGRASPPSLRPPRSFI